MIILRSLTSKHIWQEFSSQWTIEKWPDKAEAEIERISKNMTKAKMIEISKNVHSRTKFPQINCEPLIGFFYICYNN